MATISIIFLRTNWPNFVYKVTCYNTSWYARTQQCQHSGCDKQYLSKRRSSSKIFAGTAFCRVPAPITLGKKCKCCMHRNQSMLSVITNFFLIPPSQLDSRLHCNWFTPGCLQSKTDISYYWTKKQRSKINNSSLSTIHSGRNILPRHFLTPDILISVNCIRPYLDSQYHHCLYCPLQTWWL